MRINTAPSFSITKPGPKVAIIVAHSDDEAFWTAGLMLMKPTWNFEIRIVANQPEHRQEESKNAMQMLQGFRKERSAELKREVGSIDVFFDDLMIDTYHEKDLNRNDLYTQLDAMDFTAYDAIVTHNIQGEYRHVQHRWLGQYFKKKQEEDSRFNVWHFFTPTVYRPSENFGMSMETLYLVPKTRKQKLKIFRENYRSQLFLFQDKHDEWVTFQLYSGCEMFTSHK